MTPATASSRISIVLLTGLALYLAAVLVHQISLMTDLDLVHSATRSLFAYQRYAEPNGLADDYLTSYLSAFNQPYLYDGLTRAWLSAGGDLIVLHRVIPLFCWLAFLAGIAVAGRRVGDNITAVCALALAGVQPLYLLQITSSMPHAFGFPLMAWAVVALLLGSAYGLAAVTLLSGLLYPAIAPLAGLLLTWVSVIDRPLWRQDSGARMKTVLLLAVTGLLSLWLVIDAITGPSGLGPPLAPGEKTDLYPENSADGRLSVTVISPMTFVAGRSYFQFREALDSGRLLLLFLNVAIGLYGLFILLRDRASRNAMLALALCTAAVSMVILALKPHFVYRFVYYPGYTLLPLLTVVGLQQFCRRCLPAPGRAATASVVLVALLALCFDSFDRRKTGYVWRLDDEAHAVLDFAAEQPADTLFAVWPARENELELIPYLLRRPLFLTIYVHRPSHEDHVLKMRARMNALIDAYLATDPAALRRLHCDWAVDYLIAEKAHFRDGAEAPDYAAPFDARIRKILQETSKDDFVLRHPDPALVAFETGRYAVLRLGGPCNGGESPDNS